MRLDMLEAHTLAGGNARERGHLVDHEVFHFLQRRLDLAPAKADEVRKAGMGADCDTARLGQRHSGSHDAGIACVEAARDIRRGNARHQGGVVTHRPGAE